MEVLLDAAARLRDCVLRRPWRWPRTAATNSCFPDACFFEVTMLSTPPPLPSRCSVGLPPLHLSGQHARQW